MAKDSTITGQIKKSALNILAEKPEGVRLSDLRRKISEQNGSFNSKTIASVIWNLEVIFPDKVYKPDRGLLRLVKFKEDINNSTRPTSDRGYKQEEHKRERFLPTVC